MVILLVQAGTFDSLYDPLKPNQVLCLKLKKRQLDSKSFVLPQFKASPLTLLDSKLVYLPTSNL